MMKSRILFPLLIVGILLVAGCRRDKPFWDVGVVAPVLNASLTIDDLLPDSVLQYGPAGEVSIVYETKFIGLSDTLFAIPDTTIDTTFHIPLGSLTVTPNTLLTPSNSIQQTHYDLNGIEIVSGKLRKGFMSLRLRNDIRKRVKFRYQIPSATRNSIPFDTSFIIPAAPDSLTSAFADATINLAGYDLNLTGSQGNSYNTLLVQYEARIDPTETGQSTIYPADYVGINTTFSGLVPEFIRGYFGSNTIQIGPETTNFSLFNRIRSGSLGLEQLNMDLVLENYVGMDARVTLNDIWSTNTRTGNTVHLTAPMMNTPINVDRAAYSWGTPPSIPWTQTYSLNNSNSNARDLVQNLPDQLGYNVTLITNPLGNVSGNNDFFFMDWGFNGKLRVEMPLSVFASDLVLADTIAADFSSVEHPEDILRGDLTLHTINGFPLDAQVQLYLLDANGAIVDSLISQPNTILSSPRAVVSSHFVSSGTTATDLQIHLNEQQTQNLFKNTRILIVTKFDTNSAPSYIQIYNTDKIDFRVTADFDYQVNN